MEIDGTEIETEIEIVGIPEVMEESRGIPEIIGGHTHIDRKRIKKTDHQRREVSGDSLTVMEIGERDGTVAAQIKVEKVLQ